MDGNMSADHQRQKHPQDDVELMQGRGFLVSDAAFGKHLKIAHTTKMVSETTATLTAPIADRRSPPLTARHMQRTQSGTSD
jgi:hypothetical protein